VNGRTFGELLASEHKDHFYMMHLSYGSDKTQRKRLWEYAIHNNTIGLDWETVRRDWDTLSESERQGTSWFWTRQFNLFCKEMRVSDYVVILNGIHSVLGIAKITETKHHFRPELSSYSTNPFRFFDHVREYVTWIKQYPWDGYALSEPLTFDGTLDRVTPRSRSPRWRVLTMIDP
jgi:hypothetical protein